MRWHVSEDGRNATHNAEMAGLVFSLVEHLKKQGVIPDYSLKEIWPLAIKSLCMNIIIFCVGIVPVVLLGKPFLQLAEKSAFLIVWGIIIAVIGSEMNKLVKRKNNDKMPVMTTNPKIVINVEKKSDSYQIATKETKHKLLCDRIHTLKGASSLGDVFVDTGRFAQSISFCYAFAYVMFLFFFQ